MTELKTLKDLRCDACDRDGHKKIIGKSCPVSVDTEELKQEAIKWVKGMENARYKDGENFNERQRGFEEFYDNEYDSFCYVINWIMHFFNITKEELK